VLIHKVELFTPPEAIDGNDFSGNLIELVEVDDAENTCYFMKMEKALERVEFKSGEEKKSWIVDIEKAAKVYPCNNK
jgi:hypothetical protein